MKKTIFNVMLLATLAAMSSCLFSCTKDPENTDDQVNYVDPIYTNDFDKAEATKDYGSKKNSWPYLDDEFDGWINHSGYGASAISYEGQSISIRANQSSQGEFSLYEGSGKNNIFFSTAPNHFIVKGIEIPHQHLRLTFGAQRYAQGGSNEFMKSDFEIRVSADGQTWSQPLEYSFEGEDGRGMWRKATMDFTLPEDVKTLSIRFVAKISSVNRLDDLTLTCGHGGQQVVFGGDETVKVSSIKDVIAAETDHIYRIKGQIIGTHDKGFLVKDETGVILTFKKKHGMKVGSTVEVQGPTTTYGGMTQFGESSEITVISEGTYEQPVPEEFGAAEFEAYMSAPSIKYIHYVGTMTSYRDQIWQWHNNVTVEGTKVLGAIMYPSYDMNIKQYENKVVSVTGYAVGAKVTSDEQQLLNTMVTEIHEVQ